MTCCTRSLALSLLLLLVSCVPQTVDGGRPTDDYKTVCSLTSTADIPNPERGFYNWPDDFTPRRWQTMPRKATLLPITARTCATISIATCRRNTWKPSPHASGPCARPGSRSSCALTTTKANPTPADPDASLKHVLRHIEQLAPVLEANKDGIAWIEAGFIGACGEWHTSASGLDSPENKAAIRDALFQHFPHDRFILFRYPADFIGWYPQPLTEAQAFTQTPQARTGHHNDCFLASDDDEGTYYDPESGENRTEEGKAYISQMTRFVPLSGETCDPNPPRSDCETALQEMAYLHWSALNEGWYPAVIQGWKDQGCYEEIRRRLGYRLTLLEATFSPQIRPGSDLQVQVTLQNTGFAASLLERPIYLILAAQAQDGILRYTVDVDPRRWGPGERTFTVTLSLPADLPPGDYILALWLPDPADTLRDDPRYAIRFANENTWDAAHGWNVLGSAHVSELQIMPAGL